MKLEHMSPNELVPFDRNPRRNDHAVDAVARSIETFGFNCPIVVGPDNRICAGHTRWKAAKKLGLKTVPVVKVDVLAAEKFVAFNLADNQTASLAEWEDDVLKELLAELKEAGTELAELGFSDQELRSLFKDEEDDSPLAATDPIQAESIIQRGDLIMLGEHRLLCGDSRCLEDMARLVAGRKISHIFRGPPYFNQRVYAHWQINEEYLANMRKILKNCFAVADDGAVVAWNIASGSRLDHISHNSVAMEQEGFEYPDTIAWVKSGANFDIRRSCHISTTGCYFPALQWEAVLVFKKPGSMPKMDRAGQAYMKNYQTNVWEVTQIVNQKDKIGHPAVCPIEIPYRCLQAYSRKGQTILEPFGGSGTTLLAAEKAGRKACIMEQHPAYCDVIIRRWEEMTGEKAETVERSVS